MAMTLNRTAFEILVRLVHQSRRIMHITSTTPERFLRPVFFFQSSTVSHLL